MRTTYTRIRTFYCIYGIICWYTENESIIAMAKEYGVSVAQLCIRYCIQLGMIVLPKAAKAEHQKSNAEVDFEISAADMEILKRIERIKDYGDASFFPVFGGKL